MMIIAHNSLCSTHAYHLRIDLARMPLLGNVEWKSKKNLRTLSDLSMEMHSNEGESVSMYPLRPKAEAFDNAVNVVIRLHDRPILVPKVRHLCDLHTFGSVMSHELMIQQSVEGELHQHDGVMSVMMKLPTQGFA